MSKGNVEALQKANELLAISPRLGAYMGYAVLEVIKHDEAATETMSQETTHGE